MESPSIVDVLNTQFGIPGKLLFELSVGGFPIIQVETETATAVISVYAGHILSYRPKGEPDVLWLSEQAVYEPGKAIRGGIPIIWPWFGSHPTDAKKYVHGFARRMMWGVQSTGEDEDGRILITLELTETEATKALWSHDFALTLSIVVGLALEVTLTVANTGDIDFTYTAAMHSYFTVSDIEALSIRGLAGTAYLDNLDNMKQKEQVGPIRFTGETDRIYVDTTAVCEVVDPGLNRIIWIDKQGSHSTVVWNPWVEKARWMADFADNAYRKMVCVETANAAHDAVTLEPGEMRELTAVIGVKPIE